MNLQGKPLSPAAEALRHFVLEHGESHIARPFGAIEPHPAASGAGLS